MKKLIQLYHTLKYLKQKQFTYRFYYLLRNIFRGVINYQYPILIPTIAKKIILEQHQPFDIYNIYENNTFTFIGITHTFQENKIDWNYSEYGKLWNYNLTYFDFLQQENMGKEVGLSLIKNFINYPQTIRGKKMPFPISLRNINFIKFISRENIKDKEINSFLFNQYFILMDNLEYHILGNHLLENGFSLLFGAYYFEDEKLYKKASEILREELSEQILNDGAHFELSPMYHQIMLFRTLDCINLVKNNSWKNKNLLNFLIKKAQLMLGWLENISYKNGDIPLFNDSAKGIAPTSSELFQYAKKLNLEVRKIALNESGYRKKENEYYECIVDVGNIGPDYIPGHAHSDTFNFELVVNNLPVIVDTGLSTYETGQRRTVERSTSSHNTVEINGKNQTEVWGGFRVARRAKIIQLKEDTHTIEATHDGYKHKGFLHTRKWEFEKKKITIIDTIIGDKVGNSIGYLHFHPDIIVELNKNSIMTSLIRISFSNIDTLSISRYNKCNNFNQKRTSTVVIIKFKKTMRMEIIFNESSIFNR